MLFCESFYCLLLLNRQLFMTIDLLSPHLVAEASSSNSDVKLGTSMEMQWTWIPFYLIERYSPFWHLRISRLEELVLPSRTLMDARKYGEGDFYSQRLSLRYLLRWISVLLQRLFQVRHGFAVDKVYHDHHFALELRFRL